MIALEQNVEVQTRNVLLQVRELAELYALKSLYDFIAHEVLDDRLNANLFFGGCINTERSKEILASTPTQEQFRNASIDTVIGCYSDIGWTGDLSIDISILKNSVVPLSNKEKRELREKYGVPSDKPILVIGYAETSPSVARIVERASRFANIYLVGQGNLDQLGLTDETRQRVHLIDEYGILKDYYAMADVAINTHNISDSQFQLHNFVEATEGGPLFMVPSSNPAQYGYRQLVNAGVIVECEDLDDLIEKTADYLENFDGNTQVANARANHLKQTRSKYFPVILAHLRRLIGEDAEMPETDLIVTETGKGLRLTHPDSLWGDGIIKFDYLSKTHLGHYKNCSSFGFKISPSFDQEYTQGLNEGILQTGGYLHSFQEIKSIINELSDNSFKKKIIFFEELTKPEKNPLFIPSSKQSMGEQLAELYHQTPYLTNDGEIMPNATALGDMDGSNPQHFGKSTPYLTPEAIQAIIQAKLASHGNMLSSP